MKKIISIILMLFITLSLSSCSLFDWIAGDKEQEEQLESPIIIGVDEEGEKEIIVNWTSVENVEKYVISLNGREVVTLDNFFNICNVIKKSDTVEIKVKARTQGYGDSDWSTSYFYELEYKTNDLENEDDEIDTDDKTQIEMSQKMEYFNGTVNSPNSYDSTYGIGKGINVLEGKYIEITAGGTPIFDINKLMSLNWIKTKVRAQEAEIISDTSAKSFQLQLEAEYANKMSGSFGIKGLFTAGIDQDFSISNDLEISKDTKEIIAKLYHNIYGFTVEIEGYNDYRNFYSILSQKFLNDLQDIKNSKYDVKKIEDLFGFYGTHIVMAGYYGGRIECNYHLMFEGKNISNTTMISYKNSVKGAMSYAQYSASVQNGNSFSIKNQIDENIQSTLETFTFKGRGGEYFQGYDLGTFMSGYSSWVNSFNEDEDNYSVLVDVPDNALMPIWALIPPEYSDVAEKIRELFISKADTYYTKWLEKCSYTFKEEGNIIDFGGGMGTEDDPYLIENEHHLASINNYLGKENVYFKLVNDITITGNRWQPIGKKIAKSKAYRDDFSGLSTEEAIKNSFMGVFDGNNKTIKYEINMDLFITEEGKDYSFGLFALLRNSIIKNLNVEGNVYGTSVTYGDANTVGLVSGWAINTDFIDCTTSGKISQDRCAGENSAWVNSGGFVGIAKECVFIRCTNKADVSTNGFRASSAGLVASGWNCRCDPDCVNTGKITAYYTGSGKEKTYTSDLIYEE